jgi:hypothetical protein
VRTREELERLLRASGISWSTAEEGEQWMIAAPALGARILGAGIGPENAFWVPPSLSTNGWEKGGNAGGQRSWIAPEAGPGGFFFTGERWAVPAALDPGDYRPRATAPGWLSYRSAFSARAADGSQFPVAITRSLRLEATPHAARNLMRIRFQHELENTGASLIRDRVGLWSIIQLPCEEEGTILLRRMPDDAILPRPYFTDLPPGVLRNTRGVSLLGVGGGRKYKIGLPAPGSAGVVAFLRRARVPGTRPGWILTAQKFAVDPAGTYMDKPVNAGAPAPGNGDAAQAYNDPGTGELAFCEIEAHAPTATLAPGESQKVEIEIIIARDDEPGMREILSRELGFAAGAGAAFSM